MSTRETLGPRPSDEELMMLLDGELDEPRRAQVAAWATRDAELGAKQQGLELVSALVSDSAGADSRADGIADAVMAELVSKREGPELASPPVPLLTRGSRRHRWFAGATPANENTRGIFWMAGLAAAVAAGLFFWSRSGLQDMPLTEARSSSRGAATAVALGPEGSGPEPKWLAPSATAEAEHDEGPSPVVEVAAVDFGSNTGSVFYVSTGASQATTTTAVIWVTDKVAGK